MVQFNKNKALSVFRRLGQNANWIKFKEHDSYPLNANSSVNEVTENINNSILKASKSTIPLKNRRSIAPFYMSSQFFNIENKEIPPGAKEIHLKSAF